MSIEQSTRDEREQQLDAIIAAYYRAIEAGEGVDQNDFIAQHPEVQRGAERVLCGSRDV